MTNNLIPDTPEPWDTAPRYIMYIVYNDGSDSWDCAEDIDEFRMSCYHYENDPDVQKLIFWTQVS